MRALIVETDDQLRSRIAQPLRRAGYETVEATTGAAALEALTHDATFAVILSELHMPDMNGRQLLSIVKDWYPTIPVILLRSQSLHRWAPPMNQATVDGYLPKPFSQQQLLATVQAVAGTSQRAAV